MNFVEGAGDPCFNTDYITPRPRSLTKPARNSKAWKPVRVHGVGQMYTRVVVNFLLDPSIHYFPRLTEFYTARFHSTFSLSLRQSSGEEVKKSNFWLLPFEFVSRYRGDGITVNEAVPSVSIVFVSLLLIRTAVSNKQSVFRRRLRSIGARDRDYPCVPLG